MLVSLNFPEYIAMAYQSQMAEPEDHLSANIHSAHWIYPVPTRLYQISDLDWLHVMS